VNLPDLSSSSLLRRAASCEPEAWRRLVRLFAPVVRYWSRQAGVPEQDIQDVTQEVFAALAARLGDFRDDRARTSFPNWLYGIAQNKILDYFRHRRETAIGGPGGQEWLQDLPAPSADPESSDVPLDGFDLYQRALGLARSKFEERTWRAFWRVAIDDLSPAEVAGEMGMTGDAVRQAKSRVIRRLKAEFGDLLD
jgi:RNA polymerase sigma-70 factor (ECF subfamily)